MEKNLLRLLTTRNNLWIEYVSLSLTSRRRNQYSGYRPLGEQLGEFWVGELNFWLGELDELANVISNLANAYINFANFILTWRTQTLFHFKNGQRNQILEINVYYTNFTQSSPYKFHCDVLHKGSWMLMLVFVRVSTLRTRCQIDLRRFSVISQQLDSLEKFQSKLDIFHSNLEIFYSNRFSASWKSFTVF